MAGVDSDDALPTSLTTGATATSIPTLTHLPSRRGPSEMGPPRKRVRLSEEAYGNISEKESGDLPTSLEVDFMILDCLSHHAISACLSHPSSLQASENEISLADGVLVQVDKFRALFKTRYPRYRFDAEMRFRQQLLQLVTLFTQRLTKNDSTPSRTSLETLRANNQDRARRWIGDASRLPTAGRNTQLFDQDLPIAHDELDRNRNHVLHSLQVAAEDDAYEDAFYGTSACVSLLDILPLFMRLSASLSRLYRDGNINEGWMQLAAQWMLQACLEQYLVFGASGSDAVDEAFAWGYKKQSTADTQQDRPSDDEVNDMLEDDKYAREVDGWSEIRDATLEELLPLSATQNPTDIVPHLLALAARHPLARTEGLILSYLKDLAQAIPAPVLVQLDQGQLDGMSEAETQEFMRSCGLGDSIASLLS